MPLYIKDFEVDGLATRLATLRRTSKTEVVRQALLHELQREEGVPTLVDQGVAFVQELLARAKPEAGHAIDKAYIDGLYGQP